MPGGLSFRVWVNKPRVREMMRRLDQEHPEWTVEQFQEWLHRNVSRYAHVGGPDGRTLRALWRKKT